MSTDPPLEAAPPSGSQCGASNQREPTPTNSMPLQSDETSKDDVLAAEAGDERHRDEHADEYDECALLFRLRVRHSATVQTAAVTHLFPVPTVQEVLLNIIGSTDAVHGKLRPDNEVLNALHFIADVLLQVLRQPHSIKRGGSRELCIDMDSSVAMTTPQLHLNGVIDYLTASGFERVERSLVCDVGDDNSPGMYRAAVGLQYVREEISLMHATPSVRRYTVPALSQIGPMLTEYDSLQKALDGTTWRMPTFEDLLSWIKLRNFFFVCSVVAEEDEVVDDDVNPWFSYLISCRTSCQDVLQQIEKMHVSLRCPSSLFLLQRDSAMIQRQLEPRKASAASHDTPHNEGTDTPQDAHYSSPSTVASPGECLTRTPSNSTDKRQFLVAQPPLEEWARDPQTSFAGLLNVRQCCYVNCILQVLYHLPGFASCVMALPSISALRSRWGPDFQPTAAHRVASRLQALFAYLKISSASCVNPIPLLDAVAAMHPSLGDGAQHDPHEFICHTIDAVVEAFRACQKDPEGEAAQVAPFAREVRSLAFEEEADPNDPKVAAVEAATVEAEGVPAQIPPPPSGTKVRSAHAALEWLKRTLSIKLHEQRLGADRIWRPEEVVLEATNFIPLYYDPQEYAPKAPPAALHVDPASTQLLGKDAKMGDTERPTNNTNEVRLERCLDEYFTEFRDDPSCTVVGSMKYFHRDDPPSALFFFVPSRSVATQPPMGPNKESPKQLHRFRFPLTLDCSMFLADSPYVAVRKSILEDRARMAALHREKGAKDDAIGHLQAAMKATTEHDQVEALDRILQTAIKARGNLGCEYDAAHQRVDANCRRIHDNNGEGVEPFAYTLHAVVVHVGFSSERGHFYTYLHDLSTGTWHCFDDTRVREATVEEVTSDATTQNVYCMSYLHMPSLGKSEWEFAEGDIPQRLQRIIDREDTRKQLKIAQKLSEGV